MANNLTTSTAEWQRQISKAVATYQKYFVAIEQEMRPALEYAAIPLVSELKRRAPVGTRVHYRYKSGKREATYQPGNLKNSFRVLELKRTADVFVGAQVARRGRTSGRFGVSRSDAYYLPFVEYGTRNKAARPFVRPSIISAGPHVLRRVELAIRRKAMEFERKNAIR